MTLDAVRFAYGKTLSGVITKTEPWDKIAKVITGKLRVYESKAESTNAPNILGGPTDNRGKEDRNVLSRSLLTMDYDDLPSTFDVEDMSFALDMLGYAAVCYTTFSHRTDRAEGGVRLRVIVPLSEEIPVEAYPAAVRSFTDELGIECSPESYTVAQVMFLHSAMTGFESEAWTHIVEGDPYPVSEAWSETAGSGDLDDLDDDDFLLDIAYEPLDVIDAEVDKALELLVAEGLDYDDWLMVGAALFHQYRGSLDDDGFGRWLAWSRQSSKHDGKLMRKKWKSFGGRQRPITMASVFARVGGLSAVRDNLGDDVEVVERGEVVEAKPKGALALLERFSEAAVKIDNIADYEKIKQGLLRVPESRLGSDYRAMIADEIFTHWGKGAGLSKGEIKKAISAKARRDGAGGDAIGDRDRVLVEDDFWSDDRPVWLRGWAFDETEAEFVRVDNGHCVKRESFRMKYDRMPECAEHEMDAVSLASKIFAIPTVSGRMYWPGNGRVFQSRGKGSGLSYLNTWFDGEGAEIAPEGSFEVGDDSLEGQATAVFLRHLERTIVDERERALVLDWMAWVYNNPGSRVRWALLLWGIEGNGKSYFHRILTWLMGRDSRTVAASLIEERFTDWAEGCRLIGIEEIRVSGTNKWRTLDKMKPFISNDEIQVEGKGVKAKVVPNFASYMLFTNHADAIPVGEGDRRYFVVFTRHRTKQDLIDDCGGDEESVGRYFQTLFDVSHAGIGGIGRLLAEHQYSGEFDPHGRAPDSSGKLEMKMLHVSEEDEALADALEKFNGPFINDKIIDVTLLQDQSNDVFEDEIRLPKTSMLSHKLVDLGFRKGGRMKARTKNRTFWYQPNKISLEDAQKAMRSGIEQIDPDVPF